MTEAHPATDGFPRHPGKQQGTAQASANIGHLGDGLIDFYDSVQGLAEQIERDAEELRLLLIEQSKSVMEELEKFRHVQDQVENLLCDYSHEGPMREARYAILLEGLALFEITA